MDLALVEKSLSSYIGNSDFSTRGKEIVIEKRVRLGPFASVPYVLDWTQNPLENRTWQWRWGSLSALVYLISYHSEHQDINALNVGQELILTWANTFLATCPGEDGLNEFVWHDHGTALRAEHILLFSTYIKSCNLENRELFNSLLDRVPEILQKHGELLAKESFYSKHTNHGLEQTRVLLLLGRVGGSDWKESASWKDIASSRLLSEFDFAYTDEGVHVENSPAYHIFVFKVFISIINDYDEEYLGSLYTSFHEKARKILDYITHIIRPDGFLPIIGDTEKLRPTDSFKSILGGTPEYKQFLYSRSQAKLGTRPRETYKIYPKSGYAIYRNRWGIERDFARSLHAVFKGGPLSQYHRQQDEGNILLHAFGEDWLIDAGMYNYNKTDPVRAYMRSRRAHNVVIIDDVNYKTWDDIKHGWSLTNTSQQTNEKSLEFCFSGFENSTLKRSIVFEKTNLTVTDYAEILDGTSKTMRVLWHFDSKKVINIVNSKEIYITSTESEKVLKLKIDTAEDVRAGINGGIKGNKVLAVTSNIANKYVRAQVLTLECPAAPIHLLKTYLTFVHKDEYDNARL